MITIFAQFSAAVFGTVAFALLFGSPRKYYFYCGLIGGAGWVLFMTLRQFLSVPEATFFSTVLVILLSRMSAVREKCPVTVFLISGIIPLVPGAGIYWSAFYMVTDQLGKAFESGFMACKTAAAIVLGIVCVFELPQKVFGFARKRADRIR